MREHTVASLLRRTPQLMLAASLVLLAPGVSWAQSASAGTVTGTVTDSTGAVIVGAKIEISDPVGGTKRTVVTGKDGLYVLPDVQPGTYNLVASKAGFSQDQIMGLVVSTNAPTMGPASTTRQLTSSATRAAAATLPTPA